VGGKMPLTYFNNKNKSFMQVLKNFNNVSEELIKECIPPFGIDEIRTFRMLNGVVNNDPDITERLKQPVFYPDTQIRTWDRIRDPYANGGKGGFVDIGVVEKFDLTSERPTKFRFVVRGQGVGMFVLSGSSIEDVELYEFLCITNRNANFKYRDKKVEALFEMVQEVDGDKKQEEDFDLLLEAGTHLKKLTATQKTELSVLLHIDPSLDNHALSAKLTEYAKSQPSEILERIKQLKNSGKKSRHAEAVLT
jgi:hypothetical protein